MVTAINLAFLLGFLRAPYPIVTHVEFTPHFLLLECPPSATKGHERTLNLA